MAACGGCPFICADCRRHVHDDAPCPFCGSARLEPAVARRGTPLRHGWVGALLGLATTASGCPVYGGPGPGGNTGYWDAAPEDAAADGDGSPAADAADADASGD